MAAIVRKLVRLAIYVFWGPERRKLRRARCHGKGRSKTSLTINAHAGVDFGRGVGLGGKPVLKQQKIKKMK